MDESTLWMYTNCEYIYEPQHGDHDNNIPAGTLFDDLPKDWVCPICGTEKNLFKPSSEEKNDS